MEIITTDLEAIELRHSRRAYLDTPINSDHIKELKVAIKEYNKLSGLSIQLIEEGQKAFQGMNITYGMFSGVSSFFAIVGKTSDEHVKEKAGYYGELLVLLATKLGLGTCWVGGTFNRKQCLCTVREGEALLIIIPVGNVSEKNSFKENAIYKLIHRRTKTVEELYTADAPVPQWFIEGIKAIQKAPSAINKQPVHFTYQAGNVTAKVDNMDGSLPIDLGIAKAHFEIAAGGTFALGNNAAFTKRQA